MKIITFIFAYFYINCFNCYNYYNYIKCYFNYYNYYSFNFLCIFLSILLFSNYFQTYWTSFHFIKHNLIQKYHYQSIIDEFDHTICINNLFYSTFRLIFIYRSWNIIKKRFFTIFRLLFFFLFSFKWSLILLIHELYIDFLKY